MRETEITDSLVELFIQLIHKINTRAEKKAEGEFNKELKRVRGGGHPTAAGGGCGGRAGRHGPQGDLSGGRGVTDS
jgi:oligoribonuclease NrnB/cAMP/cGMP phosphodiesterase (DHH superfamily)